jgi:hypothetical protein
MSLRHHGNRDLVAMHYAPNAVSANQPSTKSIDSPGKFPPGNFLVERRCRVGVLFTSTPRPTHVILFNFYIYAAGLLTSTCIPLTF